MKTLTGATVLALALLASAMVPVTSASAADLSVAGTVTLEGAPIGGVEVGWYDPLTDAAGETVADSAGAYALTVPDGHPYVLYAGIDHRAGNVEYRWRNTGGASYIGVYLGANGADLQYLTLSSFTTGASGQNINLVRPAIVTGTNTLLANRRIGLNRTNGVRVRTVLADANGTFAFTGVFPGDYRLAVSEYPNIRFAKYRSPTLTAVAGQTTRLDPVFEKTGSITGVITNKGKPVAGVRVQSTLHGEYSGFDVTDARGRYRLRHQSPGTHVINLEHDTDDSVINNRKVFDLARTTVVGSGKVTHLDMSVKKGGGVSGLITSEAKDGTAWIFVVDPRGELVGSSLVPTKANEPTSFTVNAVVPGRATIYITKGDKQQTYGSAQLVVRAGIDNRVGVLGLTKKTVTLSGKVTGASTGTVYFYSSADYLTGGEAKIKHGRYTITRLIPVRGGVSVGATDTRLDNFYSVTPGVGVTQSVRAGAARPAYAATYFAGLYPLPREIGMIWTRGGRDTIGFVSITNGLAGGDQLTPGTGTLELSYLYTPDLFQQSSPFYLTVPKPAATITLKAGETTNGGTVHLTLHR